MMETTEIRPGVFLNHHYKENCSGRCPLHNPTDHPYREFPMWWRNGIIEREIAPGVFQPDPDDIKVRKGGYLYRNSAICGNCGEEIISESRHEFVTCSCGSLSVDGGHSYTRRVYTEGTVITDTSIYLPKI